jgi:hypothetical protein
VQAKGRRRNDSTGYPSALLGSVPWGLPWPTILGIPGPDTTLCRLGLPHRRRRKCLSASKIVMVGFSAAIVVTSVGDIEPNHQHQSGKTITSLAASSATVAPISAFIVYARAPSTRSTSNPLFDAADFLIPSGPICTLAISWSVVASIVSD